MNCKKAEEYLVEYLYQELSAKKTVELEKHLPVCDRCRQTLESWQAIHRGFQKTEEVPQASPYLKQRILVAAREEIARKPSLTKRLVLVFKIASVPLAIFVIVLLLNIPPEEQTKMVQQKEEDKPEVSPGLVDSSEQLASRRRNEAKPDFEPGRDYKSEGRQAANQEKSKKRAGDESFGERREIEEQDKDLGAFGYLGGSKEEMARAEEEKVAPAPAMPAAPEPAESVARNAAEDRLARQQMPLDAPSTEASKSKLLDSENAFRVSQTMFQRGDAKQGQIYAVRAISQDENKSLANDFHQSGIEFQKQADYAMAIVQFNLLLQHYPDYSGQDDVLMRLAESYEQLGEFDKALSVYNQLVQYSPGDKKVRNKIRELNKKQEGQKQLRSLGMTEEKNR